METENIVLSSTRSTQISLNAVKYGRAELSKRRKGLLDKVPNQSDDAEFAVNSIELRDLAYLTAKTGDEFAIMRGKDKDILWHGTPTECDLLSKYKYELEHHKLELYGHSHPGEPVPIPSPEDRMFLRHIGQKKSLLVSGMTGFEREFSADYWG